MITTFGEAEVSLKNLNDVCAAALVAAIFSACLYAQRVGSISGVVAIVDATGNYPFPNLILGAYELTVSTAGFRLL